MSSSQFHSSKWSFSSNIGVFILRFIGGRIDHAHHRTMAHLALDETVEFHKAVEVARAKVDTDDTLILVTADHSHTMTIGGYPVS
jgi:alkaline phosphatase